MKNKSLLSIEKNIIKGEKKSYYNYKVLFFKKVITWKVLFDEEFKDVLKNQL